MSGNRSPSNIEEFCKKSFHKFLKKDDSIKNIEWCIGNNPPDYILKLKNKSFAVEVTTIMEKIEVGKGSIGLVSIQKSLQRLLDEIEKEALSQGILRGSYAVSFNKPVSDFRKERIAIKDALLNFIKETKNEQNTGEIRIYKKVDEKISVLKVDESPNRIYFGPALARAKWHGEAKQEALEIIQQIIDNKTKKLSKISLPKILLIYNHHSFMDLEDYKNFCISIERKQEFHSIFIVENVDKGITLCSEGF